MAYNLTSILAIGDRRLRKNISHLFCTFLIISITLSSCTNKEDKIPVIETQSELQTQTPTATPFQPMSLKVYWSPAVPEDWITVIKDRTEFQNTQNNQDADLNVDVITPTASLKEYGVVRRIFAAAVPFPTVTDGISSENIKALWQGIETQEKEFSRIIVDEATARVFTELWGDPNMSFVNVMAKTDLLQDAWTRIDTLAILPFEDITPKWKILKVDGFSPLDKPMAVNDYALSIKYYLTAGGQIVDQTSTQKFINAFNSVIPETNKDESKMTVVVMSGTTALTRATAFKINTYGTDYPIEKVKDWFLSADLRHVSNEISFVEDCPEPDPYTSSMRFCASISSLPVLEKLGINVVELTGNHVNDYGSDNFAKTIRIYQENGMSYFGGGLNSEEAKQPLLIEKNGNKIAFIGCNPVGVGPATAWAKDNAAGAAKCDDEYYYGQIRELKAQGYVVIATFQHYEIYLHMYDDFYEQDFVKAAEAGADIVQGSQAHYPMGFEFKGESLIHYGLGNFLFDQMDTPVQGTRREFIDRHIIYDGQYINTELLTALLVDWSKPTPMSIADREQFLSVLFNASKMR
jgi:hypothetical protein